jgi:D-alanyl-D-alanine carboxypeptidase/D-alanyl-D-alanine-endopeptidase (penicillin-binding protein 4)
MSPLSRRTGALLAAAVALAAPAAAAASPESGLRKSLARDMSAAGPEASAFVRDADKGGRLFAWSHTKFRILASNTKLFTATATLAMKGVDARIPTRAMADHALRSTGLIGGNLYLVGGGDPAFGSRAFVRANYGGGGATVEKLAQKLHDAGLREVVGSVVGDESLYDSRRSGPAEHYLASGEVGGPLSALAYDHGLMSDGHFQSDPPQYAAAALTDALLKAGVIVDHSARAGRAKAGAAQLAKVSSLPMRRLVQITLPPSDNYFAELFAKGLGGGTTAGGASAIAGFAKQERGVDVRLADGSGLSRDDQSTPQQIVHLLERERTEPEFGALYSALPIAGVSGTLADRMRSGDAHGNCRAKTGTLHDVSSLSGYCKSRSGHTLVFSILMNGVSSISHAHELQDKMAESMASYDG